MSDVIKSHLRHYCKNPSEITEAAVRVAELLDRWCGLHHIDPAQLKKADWSNPRYIVLKLSRYHSPGCLATYDFADLTNLVFLAHDLCIRVAISPCNPQFLELTFHPREREGGASLRHPTIEQAIADWRQRNDAPYAPSKESVLAAGESQKGAQEQ